MGASPPLLAQSSLFRGNQLADHRCQRHPPHPRQLPGLVQRHTVQGRITLLQEWHRQARRLDLHLPRQQTRLLPLCRVKQELPLSKEVQVDLGSTPSSMEARKQTGHHLVLRDCPLQLRQQLPSPLTESVQLIPQTRSHEPGLQKAVDAFLLLSCGSVFIVCALLSVNVTCTISVHSESSDVEQMGQDTTDKSALKKK